MSRLLRSVAVAGVAAVATAALAGCTSDPATGSTVTAATAGNGGSSSGVSGSIEVDANAPNPGAAAVALPPGGMQAALAQLPELVKTVMGKSHVPGFAVAVVHGGKTVYTGGFGVKKVGTTGAIDPETVFQVASVSKPIAATVVASEVSKGVVHWDTPVVSSLPEFALADAWTTSHVTIGDAFAHRTGLPKAAGDLLEDLGYDRDYVISHLRYEPLNPFRSSYGYANFGLTSGAQSVAKAAGTDWETLSQQQLYGPLGMTSTSSRYSDYLARSDRATIHAYVDGKFQPLYQRDADPQSPAGGVSSNVVDMAKWMALVLGNGTSNGIEIAKPEDLLPAISPQIVNSPPSSADVRAGSYGFGFNVGTQPGGRTSLGHSGGFASGTGTAVSMIPSADVGIVVLTNGASVGAAETVTSTFMDLVQFGHATRDWWPLINKALSSTLAPAGDLAGATAPPAPAAPAVLSTYQGTFHNAYYGDAVVREENGGLVVALGPSGKYLMKLAPWDGNTFAFVPTGENAPAGSKSSATFTVAGSSASSLKLEFFDGTGLGTWKR